MAVRQVSFPLQAPGERAGDVLGELRDALNAQLGLGSDGIVTLELDADSLEEARGRVLEAIHTIQADGYFDLTGLREPMCVSVRRYRLGAGTAAELGRALHQGYLELLGATTGFVAYHLVDAGGGDVTSVKVFSGSSALADSDARTADWEREHLGRFRMRRVEGIDGDVLATRRAR